MPVYPLLVVTFCVSVAFGWQWLDRRSDSEGKRRAVAGLIVLALLALIGLRFASSWPATNQRDQIKDTALLPGQLILAADPPAGAAILGVTDEALSLRYMTEVWGLRPDVAAVSSAEASEVLRSGERPLWVTVSAVPILQEEVPEAAYLSSAGQDLIAAFVQPPTAFPDNVELVEIDVGEGLVLAGYGARPAGDGASGALRLVWRADHPIVHDWSVSVRPTLAGQYLDSPAGGIVQTDQAHPVHGASPTSRWVAGQIVADDYAFDLPAGSVIDGVEVVVYRRLESGEFENLAVLTLPLDLDTAQRLLDRR